MTTNQDIEPTPAQAKQIIELIDNMLPKIKASDERDARRNHAAGRRAKGEYSGDGTEVIASIVRGSHAAINGRGAILTTICVG